MSKMRILMIGPVPPPFGGGMAAYMDIVLRSKLPDQVLLRTIDTTVAPLYFKYRPLRVFLAMKFVAILMWRLVTFRPDILHVHTSAHAGFWEKAFFVRLGSIFNVPGILHIHGSEFQKFFSESSRKQQIQAAMGRCERVIALSPKWGDFLGSIVPPQRVVVIENGIDLKPFRHRGGANEPVRILFVGTIGERKGLYTILQAIQKSALLKSSRVVFHLLGGETFYGDFEKVTNAFREASVTNAHFPGVVFGEEKYRFFAESDIFILPSFNEGLPIALIEAMASSLPVVSTTVGGIPDLVKSENGFLIEPGDAGGLAEALEKLVSDPELRRTMGRTNRQKVEAEYSADAKMDQLLALYRDVKKGRAKE